LFLVVCGANSAPGHRGAGVAPAMPVFVPAFFARTSARTPTWQARKVAPRMQH